MKTLARWARRFGLARAVCTVLLLALVPLRVLDPPPLQELRVRTFDLFQVFARASRRSARSPSSISTKQASRKSGNGRGRGPWWPT